MGVIRDTLVPLLASLRTAVQRRAAVRELRAIADEQERLADADDRVGHQLRQTAIQQRAAQQPTGRPRGSGARFVRWSPAATSRSGQRRSGVLQIGKALWQELGEPDRIDVTRNGSSLFLRPCEDGQGWKVNVATYTIPRLSIGTDSAESLGLDVCYYPSTRISGGAIIVDMTHRSEQKP